ncbi:hypothetical protein WJX73_008047 [Symbiochloris irregularis]|uniref:Protein kinase domain-containing protein n=1 Tax=Symbiochloris irregularis TaxID=706552 RepID=A0AAW1PGC2_9CHLO
MNGTVKPLNAECPVSAKQLGQERKSSRLAGHITADATNNSRKALRVLTSNSPLPPVHHAGIDSQPRRPALGAASNGASQAVAATAQAGAEDGPANGAQSPGTGRFTVYAGGPPEPDNEEERLRTVDLMEILDKPEDPVLKSMCDLCCTVFKVPLTGVSILDKSRVCYQAMGGSFPRCNYHRSLSLCGWTLLPRHPEVLIVEDILEDARFNQSPAITHPEPPGAPQMRFYAGSPLVCSNGNRLGSMCMMDIKPRRFSAEELQVLANMSEMAVRHIEKDHYLQMQKTTKAKLLRGFECFNEALLLLDLKEPGWPILYINERWADVTGIDSEQLKAAQLLKKLQPVGETSDELHQRGQRPAGKEYFGEVAEQVGIPNMAQSSEHPNTLYFAVVEPDTGPLGEGLTPTTDSTRIPLDTPANMSAQNGLDQPTTRRSQEKVMEAPVSECMQIEGKDVWVPPEMVLGVKLQHPGLVRSFKYAVAPAAPAQDGEERKVEAWLVREWCNHGTLTDAILKGWLHAKNSRNVSRAAVLATAVEMAGALMSLHSAGVVHGDLSGDCVWLADANNSRGFTAKMADFGAQAPSDSVPASHPARMRVTHAAPEMLEQVQLTAVMWDT